MLEQCSSYMTEDCSVINRSLVRTFPVVVKINMLPMQETEAQVKVLLFVAFMLLVAVLPMRNQCSSNDSWVCSVVNRLLKLR